LGEKNLVKNLLISTLEKGNLLCRNIFTGLNKTSLCYQHASSSVAPTISQNGVATAVGSIISNWRRLLSRNTNSLFVLTAL
jgi:hypothetical protein